MAEEKNNNFNKHELFAKWQKLSKQDLENLKHTLTDEQELAAYNEFIANYTQETENEDSSSTKETSEVVGSDTPTTETSQVGQETDSGNPPAPDTDTGAGAGAGTDVVEDTDKNNTTTTENQNDDSGQPVTPKSSEITKNEVVSIINEIQESNTEEQYLESIDPKITDEQIEIATSFEKASDVLEALGTTDNLLVAYDYYSKKGDKEKTTLIQEAMGLSVDELITNTNIDITSSNTYSWLQLIHKSNTTDQDKIEKALTLVATKLKAYDTQFFGELSDEELTSNYDKANTALSTTFKDCGYKYLEDNFVFTDEKGHVLKDKSLIGKSISRFLDNGDGKDLSNCQNSIVEMARELVAQDLAKNGLKIKDEDGKERDLGQNDYERLIREKIDLMLGIKPNQEGGKTSIKQSEVIGKMGSFMVGAEEFKHRASQKGYKGLYEKSTTWLKRLDDKLVERYGNKYIKAKQYAKTLGKVVKGSAIGVAKFALVSTVAGPAGVAAYIGYNTYKQWKNLSQNWDKMDKTEKTCSVIANSVSSVISVSMAAVGLDGIAEHLQGPIGTFTSTIAQNVGIWGRTAITTAANSASKVLKEIELKSKRNKIANELKDCKDPKRIQELLSENKKNIIDTRQNRENLVVSVVSSGVGTFVGQGVNQGIAEAGGLGGIIDELGEKITDRFSEQPTDVNGAKPEGLTADTEGVTADTEGVTAEKDTSNSTEEQRAENLKEATETKFNNRSVAEMLNDKLAAEAKHLGNLSVAEQQELSTKLQEIYGDKAYMAGTSAMAEPYTIVSELRNSMPAEDFAKLGFDNSITSIEVLKVLVDNPQLADNAGINKFMDTHFDAQQHFSFSEGVMPRVEQPQTTPEGNTNLDKMETPGIDIKTPLPDLDIKLDDQLIPEDKGLSIPEELTPEEQKLQAKFDNRMAKENIRHDANINEIINDQIDATEAEDTRHNAKVSRIEEQVAKEDAKYEDNMEKIVDETAADILDEEARHTAKSDKIAEQVAKEDAKYEDNMEKIVDETASDILDEEARHTAKSDKIAEKVAKEDIKYEDNMEKIVDETTSDILDEEARHTAKSDKIAAKQEGEQAKHENNFNEIVNELNEKVSSEETKHQERVSELDEKQNKEDERNERRVNKIEDKYKSRMEKTEDGQEDKREQIEAKRTRGLQREETRHDSRNERITELHTKESARHEAEIDKIVQELNQDLDAENARHDAKEASLEAKQTREDTRHETNMSEIINDQIEATEAEDARHNAKEASLEAKQTREDTRHEANMNEIINDQIEATEAEDARHDAKSSKLEEKMAKEDNKYNDNMEKIVDKTSADIVDEETRHGEKVAKITEKYEKGLEKLNADQSTQQPAQDQQETKVPQKTSDEAIRSGQTVVTKSSSRVVIENGVFVENSSQTTTTIYSEDGTILEQTTNTQGQPQKTTEGVSQTPETVLEKSSEETQQKLEKSATEFQNPQQYTEDGYTQIEDGVYKINADGSVEYSFNYCPNAALEMLPDDVKNSPSASLIAKGVYAQTQVYRDLMTQDTLSPEETIFVENYKEMIKDYGLAFDDSGRLGRAYHDTDVHRNDGVKYQCTTDGLTILSDKGLPEVEARNKVYIDLVDRGENETFGVAERDFMNNFEKEMQSQNLYHNAKGDLVEVPDNVTVSRGGMAYSINSDGVKEEGLYGYNHTAQDYMSEARSILGSDAKAGELIKMKNLLMHADIMEDIKSREASGESFTPEQKASITQFKENYEKSFDALRENHILGESLSGRPTRPSNNDILNAQNKELMTALGIDPASIPEGQTPQETYNMLTGKAKEYSDGVTAKANKAVSNVAKTGGQYR